MLQKSCLIETHLVVFEKKKILILATVWNYRGMNFKMQGTELSESGTTSFLNTYREEGVSIEYGYSVKYFS